MAISDKTRKLLWGRPGRCAICREKLFIDSTQTDNESIVGEECHIVSRRENGPRYRLEEDVNFYDSYENLILLCRVHHKMIDDQVDEYSEEKILELKAEHEQWVEEQLEQKTIKPLRLRNKKGEKVDFLHRIVSGKKLCNMLEGMCGLYSDHPEPENQYEVELFGRFFQYVSDYGDMSRDLEPADKVKECFELAQLIKELEEVGFWVFGNSEVKILEGGLGGPSSWAMAYVNIVKNDSSLIISLSDEKKNSEHS